MSGTNRKSQMIRKYFAGVDLVLRWQICQDIGKCYYESKSTQAELEDMLELLENPDNLEKVEPTINI